MASQKLSPRQKMIGMMYLVLTALLALNVSREILEAFVTVNAGLQSTGKSFDKDIAQLYSRFDEKKSVDPLRVMQNWKKAQEAKKLSSDLSDYIESMKRMLLQKTQGYVNKEEDTIHLQFVKDKENFSIPTNILCGSDENGQNGQAHELKKKLDEYKAAMLAFLPPDEQKNMNLSIDTKDPVDGGEFHTWEMKTFYDAPIAADITLLSKIQDDIKSTQADVVDALLKATDADVIPFDTVAARVIPQSNYVLLGDKYQADIFLAAFNKTLTPKVVIGGGDSVHVVNGIGKYLVNTSHEGIIDYSGTISMVTPKGKVMQYPFTSEYIVARPALTVSSDKMNVMYAGLDNPISVSVPGIPNEKLRVNCDNGSLSTQGNGKFTVTKPKAGKCSVHVVALLDSGKTKDMGAILFRVKPLPKPFAAVSGVKGNRSSAAALGASPGMLCVYGSDFDYDAHPRVISYSYQLVKSGGFGSSGSAKPGNMFDKQMQDQFKQMKKGDQVIFTDIKAVGPDDQPVTLDGDIVIRIQ